MLEQSLGLAAEQFGYFVNIQRRFRGKSDCHDGFPFRLLTGCFLKNRRKKSAADIL
jgi:hypothetical protein